MAMGTGGERGADDLRGRGAARHGKPQGETERA